MSEDHKMYLAENIEIHIFTASVAPGHQ